MSDLYRGSEWRHWDLHVHTPESYQHEFPGATHEEKWKNYLAALKALEHVAVLGITDYCTTEGYLRVKAAHDAGELPNIEAILPNIEFRLAETTREGSNINVHVIASPEIVDELPSLLLGRISFHDGREEYSARREEIVRLGRAYARNPSLEERAAFMQGAEQFKVSRDALEAAFRRSDRLRENALIALPNSSLDGNSGLRESGQRAQRLGIYHMCDVVFSRNPADREHFLAQDGKLTVEEARRDYGGLKPCIGGSDAHRLEHIGKPPQDRITWIRSDPTFDGLLQICHEPAHRVRIAAARPTQPIHRIEAIEIRVPDEAVLTGADGSEKFCFRGERTLAFAPGLTCIIGGRGAGKSTLLSLLQEAATGKSAFFDGRQVKAGDESLHIPDLVELQVSSSADEVEFLDQNQIEAFALDHRRLTEAVYKRLEKLDRGELASAIEALEAELEALQRLQGIIGERYEAAAYLLDLREKESATSRMIESLNDETYTKLVQASDDLHQRLRTFRGERQELEGLIADLEQAIRPGEPGDGVVATDDSFSERTRALRAHVRVGVDQARKGDDLSVPSPAERELQDQLEQVHSRISEYLHERGISEENARDLAAASGKLTEVRRHIEETEREVKRFRMEEEAIARLSAAKEGFEQAIDDLIGPINERLRTGSEAELRRISITYEFDRKAAVESCMATLIEEESKLDSTQRPLRTDYVAAVCSEVDWDHLPANLSEFTEVVRAGKGGEGETARRLISLLAAPGAYERFKLKVEERLTDALQFKRIEVRYDGKRLQQASFGQRCSAALIVLLMMGNQPIVIDEPEAHLDSSIIANLLVDLIKDRKSDRQIIFATHNANFVVNGDAELIHVLSVTGDAPTQVISTSLENKQHRAEILRLEGGPEAFAQREQRYGLRGRVPLA